MLNKSRTLYFVPTILALSFTAISSAQISNVAAKLGYNNEERAYDSTNTEFGTTQQFFVAPNPPTTSLISPFADYVLTNPTTGGSAELKANSALTGNLSITGSVLSVNGTGGCASSVLSGDGTSTYQSIAATESNLAFHLDSAETVTFAVNAFTGTNGGVCAYGIDNTFGSVFAADGSYSASLAAGDHFVYLYFFSNSQIAGPGSISTTAGGNYRITVDTRPVPEPASLIALGLGATTLILRRRRA